MCYICSLAQFSRIDKCLYSGFRIRVYTTCIRRFPVDVACSSIAPGISPGACIRMSNTSVNCLGEPFSKARAVLVIPAQSRIPEVLVVSASGLAAWYSGQQTSFDGTILVDFLLRWGLYYPFGGWNPTPSTLGFTIAKEEVHAYIYNYGFMDA